MSLVATHTEARPTETNGRRSRVVTLTPAPSIDRVYRVDELRADRVNRASSVEAHIAGNGVNLARDLRAAGNTVVAVAPLNFEDALEYVDDAAMFRVVPVHQTTRVNTIVIAGDGQTTNVNQAANPLTSRDWRSLYAAVRDASDQASPDWIVLGGTVPDTGGAPLDPNALLEIARDTNARICLDSPGLVLAKWMQQGAIPSLVAPNVHELEEAVGSSVATVGEACEAGQRLLDRGVETVLVSLGAAGALLITGNEQLWASTRPARVVNTTGAGDAALAGLLSTWQGEGGASRLGLALTSAVRWGRAACETSAPTIDPNTVSEVDVDLRTPDRDLAIA